MDEVADNVLSEHGIPDCFGIGRVLNATPHGRKRTKMCHSLDEFTCDARGGARVMLGDEGTKPNKIGNGLFGVDELHLAPLGPPLSFGVPQERSQS
jgi:hypothetical protein